MSVAGKCRPARRSAPARRRGFILVSVLWILIFLAFLAVVLRLHMSGVVESVRVTEDKAAARILADAGLSVAAALVRAGPEVEGEALPDILSDSVETSTGRVDVTATNEAYRIDLNTAGESLLVAAFSASGARPALARDLARKLVEGRPRQQETEPENGQLQDAAGSEPPAQAAATRFSSVAELALMPGMPQDIAIAAGKYLTVSSGLAGIRLEAQPDEILEAIPDLPGAALSAIRSWRAGRMRHEELTVRLADVEHHTVEKAISWRVGLEATLASGYSESYEAIVIVSPEDDAPFRVADWHRVPDEVD